MSSISDNNPDSRLTISLTNWPIKIYILFGNILNEQIQMQPLIL